MTTATAEAAVTVSDDPVSLVPASATPAATARSTAAAMMEDMIVTTRLGLPTIIYAMMGVMIRGPSREGDQSATRL